MTFLVSDMFDQKLSVIQAPAEGTPAVGRSLD